MCQSATPIGKSCTFPAVSNIKSIPSASPQNDIAKGIEWDFWALSQQMCVDVSFD